ncbi:hypothetical protein [Taibaiella chishuiensis]|nr:hypothetical protein [Taibaiella chishuiensis]
MNLKNRFFLSLLLAAALCFPAALLYAQPAAGARVDARKITIGDHLRLWLEVKPGAKGNTVLWPKPDTLYGLEIVERGKIDTVQNADTYLLKQRLLVTGFDSGRYYIPSFAFKVMDKGGQVTELYTDSIAIEVATIPVDTTKAFKPIKEIVEVQSSWLDYWKIILAVILLVGLGIFVWYYFYRNRGTKIPQVVKVPPEKAHEKAVRQLQELQDKHLPEQGRVKEYYSGLSDIIRTYLEERYGITAMEQTTDELLALLKKQTESRAELRKVRPELKMILRTADLAKFAKASPNQEEQNACMTAAMEVIKRTQFKPEEDAS